MVSLEDSCFLYLLIIIKGDRSQRFSTVTEYFQYIIDQDWNQLREQPNSIAGELDAISKYTSLKILESLISQFVNEEYQNGPFKLICDDFGPANMIVKSDEDLTIVGVCLLYTSDAADEMD